MKVTDRSFQKIPGVFRTSGLFVPAALEGQIINKSRTLSTRPHVSHVCLTQIKSFPSRINRPASTGASGRQRQTRLLLGAPWPPSYLPCSHVSDAPASMLAKVSIIRTCGCLQSRSPGASWRGSSGSEESRTEEGGEGTESPSGAGLFSLLASPLEGGDVSLWSVIAVMPQPAAPLGDETSTSSFSGKGLSCPQWGEGGFRGAFLPDPY